LWYRVKATNIIGSTTSDAKKLLYKEIPLPPLNISQNIVDNGVTPTAAALTEG